MTTYILSLHTALLLHIARQLNAIRRQKDMRPDALDGELDDLIKLVAEPHLEIQTGEKMDA